MAIRPNKEGIRYLKNVGVIAPYKARLSSKGLLAIWRFISKFLPPEWVVRLASFYFQSIAGGCPLDQSRFALKSVSASGNRMTDNASVEKFVFQKKPCRSTAP
jgi:hypothetical protein